MANVEKMAILFKMLCEEYDGADVLGKKAAQKMFYFMEREGLDLNLRYSIHYYGPYSAKLDDVMYTLESDGYISINATGRTHSICMGSESTSDCLTQEEKAVVKKVLCTFEHKPPMELEALSTMDYIANFILPKNSTQEDIINKFKEIKGSKFDTDTITETLKELEQLNLVAV